jgi:hypothetical protein
MSRWLLRKRQPTDRLAYEVVERIGDGRHYGRSLSIAKVALSAYLLSEGGAATDRMARLVTSIAASLAAAFTSRARAS